MTFFGYINTIMKVDVGLGQLARVVNSSPFYLSSNPPFVWWRVFVYIFCIDIVYIRKMHRFRDEWMKYDKFWEWLILCRREVSLRIVKYGGAGAYLSETNHMKF